jgi:hypothetical protein
MSTARLFRDDYLNSGAALDENTVITDYWLDFVVVRAGTEEPSQTQAHIVTEDLHERVQDFGHSIEALLEGSKQLQLELERITCRKQPFSERIREWESTSISLQKLSSDPLRTHHYSAEGKDRFRARRQRSIADRFRSSFLYNTIQKFL